MSRTIAWLHISDRHAGKPDSNWDAAAVTTTLVTDLKEMANTHELQPDFICFTGDAAWGQIGSHGTEKLSKQFEIAGEFLNQVRRAFSPEIPVGSIFLVPGNHDVDRTVVTQSQADWLEAQKDATKVSKMINEGSKNADWRRYMERLRAYRAFLKGNGYTHLLQDPDRLIYHAPCQTSARVEVCIGGFNTVWSCSGGEKKSIWMGSKWQMRKLAVVSRYDVSIALMHHPPNWLTEFEDYKFAHDLEDGFNFVLHGHEHSAWVTPFSSGHTRIAAGACYESSEGQNGYNFVRLDLETAEGEVWLRRFDPQGGGWGPCFVKNHTDDHGRWQLTHLSWLKKKRDSLAVPEPPAGGGEGRALAGVKTSRQPGTTEEETGGPATEVPLTPLELPELPDQLTWRRMEDTIRNEINELRVSLRKRPCPCQEAFDEQYADVQRNILALALRVTDDPRHRLSSNWMDIHEDRNGHFLAVSTHQGFYSYLYSRRTFRLDATGERKREGGSCGWAFAHRTVYLSRDTRNDPLIYFSETIPGEKETLRSVINIPIPIIEEGVEYQHAQVKEAVRQGRKLPHRDIGAVLNIDSPFANIFSRPRLADRIARLILLAGLLLGVRIRYGGKGTPQLRAGKHRKGRKRA